MSPKHKIASLAALIACAILFALASFIGSIRVETIQSNGLPEVQYLYSGVSFFAIVAAVGLLFFGITLALAILTGRTTRVRRPILGSGLLSSGVLAILFAAFLYIANMLDEGPRCLGGCAPSLQQYYNDVYAGSIIIVILGLIAAGFGLRVLMTRVTSIPNMRKESSSEVPSD